MHKGKKLLPGLVCLALVLSFTLAIASPALASPAIALSRYSGTSGTHVTISGAGFAGNETGVAVTWDGTPVAAGMTASPQGTWTANFTVPSSSSGPHNVSAYGSTTQPASVPVLTFVVTGSISLSRSSGAPGTSVTVTASGFGSGETGITVTYDGAIVATGITAGAQGTWSTTFSVLASASGSHTITAYGSTTQASSIATVTFMVTASISLSRSSGAPGSSVTVTGSGFGGSETGITITYDGAPVATGITASAQGAWTATFSVPASASGSHLITAYGSITQASIVPVVYFTVGAVISLSLSSGAPGSSVTVTGSGFGAAETGITVAWDGAPVVAGITARGQGAWSATFSVPASTSGSHSITAYGPSTQAAGVPEVTFIVGGSITLSQSSGASGSSLTVTGSGFGAGETGITVTYDGSPVATAITASGQGTWSATLNVPASTSGSHTVAAYGSFTQAANVDQAVFNVTAPPTATPAATPTPTTPTPKATPAPPPTPVPTSRPTPAPATLSTSTTPSPTATPTPSPAGGQPGFPMYIVGAAIGGLLVLGVFSGHLWRTRQEALLSRHYREKLEQWEREGYDVSGFKRRWFG